MVISHTLVAENFPDLVNFQEAFWVEKFITIWHSGMTLHCLLCLLLFVFYLLMAFLFSKGFVLFFFFLN